MKPIELPTLSPTAAPSLAPDQIIRLQAEVRALAEERNAVILAHNYQVRRSRTSLTSWGFTRSLRAGRLPPTPT